MVVELADALEDSVVRVIGNTVGAAAFVRQLMVADSMLFSFTIEIVGSPPLLGEGIFFQQTRVATDHA